jgi:hypothetical protein
VAAALFMSGATVKAHVSRLFTKLDGANRVQIQSSCTTVARLDALATCGTKGRATHRQGPSRRPYARGCAYACRGPHTPRPATAARGSQYEGRHPEATSSPGSIDWAHRLGNSYLVEEAGAITVIDAGVRVHWEELLRGYASLGTFVPRW